MSTFYYVEQYSHDFEFECESHEYLVEEKAKSRLNYLQGRFPQKEFKLVSRSTSKIR